MLALQSLQDLALDPTLTEGVAMMIIGLLAILGFAGVQYRSPLVMVAWLGMIIAMFSSAVLGTSFVAFWIAVVVTAASIALATVIRWATGASA